MVEKSTEDGWFVRLFGDEKELEQLSEFLDSPKCRLVWPKDTDEAYYLTACRFLNYTDAEAVKAVRESAERLLIMIKAFAKIERRWDFQSVNIGLGKVVVEEENKNTPVLIKREGGRIVIVDVLPKAPNVDVAAGSVKVGGDARLVAPVKREKTLHDNYLNICDDKIDSAVFDVLYLLAEKTSFYSLYKVYEIIKSVTDKKPEVNQNSKMISRRWVKDMKEVLAFKKSAHCYGAVKDSKGKYILRHSKRYCREQIRLGNAKPYKGKKMELPEAEDFIRRLLKKWIASKRPRVS